MYQVVEQTHAQKVKMYKKIKKKKLIEMLIACNDALRSRPLVTFTDNAQAKTV